uniref:Uncharacterized protein n=1 Tax=Trichuris muris TaxID=70415 RepID=A0A5S6QBV6_TRIMR
MPTLSAFSQMLTAAACLQTTMGARWRRRPEFSFVHQRLERSLTPLLIPSLRERFQFTRGNWNFNGGQVVFVVVIHGDEHGSYCGNNVQLPYLENEASKSNAQCRPDLFRRKRSRAENAQLTWNSSMALSSFPGLYLFIKTTVDPCFIARWRIAYCGYPYINGSGHIMHSDNPGGAYSSRL